MNKRKSTFLSQPWHLISITTGVQICEGNRVIVYIDEPNSKDHGPHRTQDVMERANLLLAAPALLAAAQVALIEMIAMGNRDNWDFVTQAYADAIGGLRAAVAEARGEAV